MHGLKIYWLGYEGRGEPEVRLCVDTAATAVPQIIGSVGQGVELNSEQLTLALALCPAGQWTCDHCVYNNTIHHVYTNT